MSRSSIVAEYRRRTPGSEAALSHASRAIPGGLSRAAATTILILSLSEAPRGRRLQTSMATATSTISRPRQHSFLVIDTRRCLPRLPHSLTSAGTYGLPYELESVVAERLKAFVPSAEMVTFTNTGMDACLLAVRAARATTGRSRSRHSGDTSTAGKISSTPNTEPGSAYPQRSSSTPWSCLTMTPVRSGTPCGPSNSPPFSSSRTRRIAAQSLQIRPSSSNSARWRRTWSRARFRRMCHLLSPR